MENFDRENCIFLRVPPSNLVYFGAKGAFRNILGSVSQKRISQNSTKGGILCRQEVESLREGGIRPFPHKSAGEFNPSKKNYIKSFFCLFSELSQVEFTIKRYD